MALAEYLETRVTLRPIQLISTSPGAKNPVPSIAKVTLPCSVSAWKQENGTVEGYHVYVGDGDSKEKFGRQLYQNVNLAELPALLEHMLKVYKNQRINSSESFSEFANRYAIAQLKQLFS